MDALHTIISVLKVRHPSHHACFLDIRWCNVVSAHNKRKKYMYMSVLQSKYGGKLEESEGYVSCVLESKQIRSSV